MVNRVAVAGRNGTHKKRGKRGDWQNEITAIANKMGLDRKEAGSLRKRIVSDGMTVDSYLENRQKLERSMTTFARTDTKSTPIQLLEAAGKLLATAGDNQELAVRAISTYCELDQHRGQTAV